MTRFPQAVEDRQSCLSGHTQSCLPLASSHRWAAARSTWTDRIVCPPLLALLLIAGCALYSDVSISPLVVTPDQIDRGSDLPSMVKRADYLRAIELASSVEARTRPSARDLLALGSAELAAGRYDNARRHLRSALDLAPFHDMASQIEWNLSQVEYLSNNYEASLDWASASHSHGLAIRDWHMKYLAAMAGRNAYRFSGLRSSQLSMRASRPDIPRIDLRVNGKHTVNAIIDSGAALSIVSERLAAQLGLQRLPGIDGTFFGLLGEPIPVHFAILDSVTLGDIVVQTVPVAIMPDDKMRFAINGKREFMMDFLLGANFLKEFRTELDFPRGVVTFTHLTSADHTAGPDQNLFLQGFRPFVRATVNKHGWFVFVIDTGSEITFINEGQLPNMPITHFTPRGHSATLQGLGGSKKRGSKLEEVEIGVDRWAGKFKTLPTYAASEHENAAGIVGENFLKNFRVVLDFGKMRVDLIRPGEAGLRPLAESVTARR